jgi:hypothetical protein
MNAAIEQYLVCFLDLLGQRDKIKEFSNLIHAKDFVKIKEVADDVINGPLQFQNLFAEGIKDFSEFDPALLSEITGNDDEVVAWLPENKVKHNRFSDSLFSHVCLPPEKEAAHVIFIAQVLWSAARTFIKGLALRQPLRGAISYGWGTEINESFYGGALVESYDLESKVAQWPRIVVGDKVINHLSSIRDDSEATDKCKHFVKLCFGLIKRDAVDNVWILHYLSPAVLGAIKAADNVVELRDAFDFVNDEHQRMIMKSDTKLAVRYKLLVDYFTSHAGAFLAEEMKGENDCS